MAEDWDLYAVVRSCAAAGTAASAAETGSESHLSCLGSLIFEEDGGDFGFPDLERPRNNAFEELSQFYRPFFPVAGDGSVSDYGGFGLESEVYELQRKRQRVLESVDSVSLFGAKRRTSCVQLPQQIQQQQREAYHHGTHENAAGTSGSLPPYAAAQPPPQISPRLRKRKSQQKRMVCEVTAENLSSDMWAWRKYGQKPIKGSPYPRNYYRCSSSKGCAARKQVEKSTTDPNVFIVTYTGDHIHPRPTHRNSLAGSTRNKISGAAKPSAGAATNPSCSSPLSAASLSPRTPLTSPVDEAPAKAEEGGDDVADDVDDDDLLIPNTAMTEDIFMGLQELGYGSGYGHRRPKLEPSWTAAAGGSAAAGGGC